MANPKEPEPVLLSHIHSLDDALLVERNRVLKNHVYLMFICCQIILFDFNTQVLHIRDNAINACRNVSIP